jgi:deazaflavin-dependent oxidoreductase (nitroreductase family)
LDPAVDKYAFRQANAVHRFMRTTAAWKPMSWLFSKTLHHIDAAVYKVTRGRKTFAAVAAGLPVCMLTTTGAKTGRARTVPLLAIPDGAGLVLIGSNYGRTFAPGWTYNLRANPKASVELGGKRMEMTATEVKGPERDELYARGVEIYPGWAVYKTRANREIPIFRLTKIS